MGKCRRFTLRFRPSIGDPFHSRSEIRPNTAVVLAGYVYHRLCPGIFIALPRHGSPDTARDVAFQKVKARIEASPARFGARLFPQVARLPWVSIGHGRSGRGVDGRRKSPKLFINYLAYQLSVEHVLRALKSHVFDREQPVLAS